MKNIIIYSTPTCHYCALAKDYFKKNNLNYTEYNVATDMEQRKAMVEKSGQLGVPVIDIEGEIMVGFDESRLTEVLGVK